MIEIQKRFVSVTEVAKYLGFSDSAIRKWVRQGMIPFHKVNGGIRFDIQLIEKWVNKGEKSNEYLKI
ncbi:MAG: helix-turn-helix domain-containing protein [Candidatus Omnitrophica bacterium]|nr:helix-turn-helix domain-containing protein [Candidatus Omnitrophota bacterium]